MRKTRIALIQRSPTVPWLSAAEQMGFAVQRFATSSLYAAGSGKTAADIVIQSDRGHNTRECIEEIGTIRQATPDIPIILIVTTSCESFAVAALRAGVRDYMIGPETPEPLLTSVRRLAARGDTGPEGGAITRNSRWVGDSTVARSLLAQVAKLAATRSTVLISGETGTGKDLAAELIHENSSRRLRPFVALNCAAIPDSLLESELFGHEKGAYTGADAAYEGRLKLAEGGTVFFDEIGDLTPHGQAKLLRVLENRQAQRLGSATEVALDIRVLAATNQDLRRLVGSGQFRRDLYYRLSVTRLDLPPLRERRDDIAALLNFFADCFSRDTGVVFPGFSLCALKALAGYDWPGNVRELRNVVEGLFVQMPVHPIQAEDLPGDITGHQKIEQPATADEKTRIVLALETTRWNKKRAAERLCWSRMTLYRKMAFYRIAGTDTVEMTPAEAGV